MTQSTHPDYGRLLPKWRMMQDAMDGAETIRRKGTLYLPQPSGMDDLAYDAYKTRAKYPALVPPTVRSMSGVIHRDPAQYDLPDALEPMRQRATQNGKTLDSLHRALTRKQLVKGRGGLLCDADESGEPYIAVYDAQAIVNWAQREDGEVDLVVLDESHDDIDRETLAWRKITQHRILRLRDGVYTVEIDRDGDIETIEPTTRGGQRLTRIPFVFVDTNDLTPEPDEVPLIEIAECAISIYRVDADYRRALFLVGSPQPWMSGISQDSAPTVWGGGNIWTMEPPDARAGMLEYTGAGVSTQRQAMVDDFQRAAELGARMFDSAGRQESGEALKVRHAAETATLSDIAQTGAHGLELALRFCAQFAGASPDDVSVTIDTDFIDRTLGAQEMQAITQAAMGGLISMQTGYELFQRGGRADPERAWEEEQELIDAPLGLIGDGDG